jgi:hypothetical protein
VCGPLGASQKEFARQTPPEFTHRCSSVIACAGCVVNAPGNSSVHVPDLPLLTGTFSGMNDLSPAILHGIPLGSIHGTFTVDGDPQGVPFRGTFRLPFALDPQGRVKDPDDEREDTFYLGDDGELIRVRPFERVLGFPPVRLELKF